MSKVLKYGFLFFFAFSFCGVQASALVLRLHSSVTVSGKYVLLGEIAQIKKSKDENINLKYLKRTKLFRLPKKTVTLDLLKLTPILRKKIAYDFVVTGSKVTIKPFYTKILKSEIIEKIKTAALARYKFLNRDSLQILALSPLNDIRIPYGDIRFRAIVPGGKFHLRKFALVQIWLDDKIFMSKTIQIRLMVYVKVLTAKRNLRKNQQLSKSCVWIKERPVCLDPQKYILASENLSKFKLRYSIKRGYPILRKSLNREKK